MVWDATTWEMLKTGIWETLFMTFASSAISYLIGIPLGIFLVVADADGIRPMPVLQKMLGVVINLLRSIPFIILLILNSVYTGHRGDDPGGQSNCTSFGGGGSALYCAYGGIFLSGSGRGRYRGSTVYGCYDLADYLEGASAGG